MHLSVEVVREDIREEKTFQMYIARSGKGVDPFSPHVILLRMGIF